MSELALKGSDNLRFKKCLLAFEALKAYDRISMFVTHEHQFPGTYKEWLERKA